MDECKVCANADNEYCFACDNGNQFKPITNADHINAMTNEEKASFLALLELRFSPKRDITADLDKGYDKWFNWLNQEVNNE